MAKKETKKKKVEAEVTVEKPKDPTISFKEFRQTKRTRKEQYLLTGMAVVVDVDKPRTVTDWEKEFKKFKKRTTTVG